MGSARRRPNPRRARAQLLNREASCTCLHGVEPCSGLTEADVTDGLPGARDFGLRQLGAALAQQVECERHDARALLLVRLQRRRARLLRRQLLLQRRNLLPAAHAAIRLGAAVGFGGREGAGRGWCGGMRRGLEVLRVLALLFAMSLRAQPVALLPLRLLVRLERGLGRLVRG
eukprot:COSAG04_NODE_5005_length_1784_cov_1.227300_2_plen_173_part_00